MKINIVKFKNGKFGIRRKTLIDWIFCSEGSFRDFSPCSGELWLRPNRPYFKDCQTDDINKAFELYHILTSSVISGIIK